MSVIDVVKLINPPNAPNEAPSHHDWPTIEAQLGTPLPSDPGAYVVPIGRVIGTAGETNIKIITRPGADKIISGYPTL